MRKEYRLKKYSLNLDIIAKGQNLLCAKQSFMVHPEVYKKVQKYS